MKLLLFAILVPISFAAGVFSKVFEDCFANERLPRFTSVAEWLGCVYQTVPADEKVRFIQIGANDGVFWDPLHAAIVNSTSNPHERWRGVLVEPVPLYMSELRKNYAQFGTEFEFVEAAVNATCSNAKATFFMPDFRRGEKSIEGREWLHGIGTLALPPGRQEAGTYRRISVDCLTPENLATFVVRHGVTRPHILMVDAEGHDEMIIQAMSTWPFGKPLLIAFESWEGICKMDDIYRFLNLHGYIVVRVGDTADYIAIYAKTL